MKPDFALDFSNGNVQLLRRVQRSWELLGAVPLDDPGLRDRMAELRAQAEALAGGEVMTKLILPENQVLFTSLASAGVPEAARADVVRRALDGMTPYAVDELAFDWEAEGDVLHVAVVARETLDEAEDFANDHGFNPVSLVARPKGGSFTGEPFFGETAVAAALLPRGERVERDLVPTLVRLKLPGPAAARKPEVRTQPPKTADVAPPATETNPPAAEPGPPQDAAPAPPEPAPAVAVPAEADAVLADDAARADDLAPSPAAPPDPAPAVEAPEPAPPLSEETAAAITRPPPKIEARAAATQPEGFDASDEHAAAEPEATGSHAREAKAPGPPLRTTGRRGTMYFSRSRREAQSPARDDPAAPEPKLTTPDAPELRPVLAQPASETGRLGVTAAQLPPISVTPPVTSAPRPTLSAPAKTLAPASKAYLTAPAGLRKVLARPGATSAAPRPAAVERTTTPVRAKATSAPSRRSPLMGFVLTAGLVAVMAAVALWSAMFGPGTDGPLPDETIQSAAPPAVETEPQDLAAAAPEVAPPETVAAATVPEAEAEPDVTPPAGLVEAAPEANPPQVAEAPSQPEPVAAPAPELPEASNPAIRYAATGIWTTAPPAPTASTEGMTTEVPGWLPERTVMASLDADFTSPPPADAPMPAQPLPPPPGAAFRFDDRGLIIPTPEGAVTPEGGIVILGRPPVVPPPRSTAIAPAAEAPAAPLAPVEGSQAGVSDALDPAAEPQAADDAPYVVPGTPETRPRPRTATFEAVAAALALPVTESPEEAAPSPTEAGATSDAPLSPDVADDGAALDRPDQVDAQVAAGNETLSTAAPPAELEAAVAIDPATVPMTGAAAEPEIAPLDAPYADPALAGFTPRPRPGTLPETGPDAAAAPAPRTEGGPIADPALAGFRPRPRPDALLAPEAATAARDEANAIPTPPAADPALAGFRPRARPATFVATAPPDAAPETSAAALTATPISFPGATDLAIAVAPPPRARPNGFAARAEEARVAAAAAAAAAAVAAVPRVEDDPEAAADGEDAGGAAKAVASAPTSSPEMPTRASVASQATVDNAIRLNQVNLIGIYGSNSDRRALVRLPSGRFVKVQVGDRVDGGQVAAISDRELRLVKNGRNVVLRVGG